MARESRQPIYVITKNALVTRDLDILSDLAKNNLVHVVISVTSLDANLIRAMEPRTSTPQARLRTIHELAENGIPVVVNIAPIIFGLTDHEVPEILRQASDAGATYARYTVLRLPGPVETIFLQWVDDQFPDRRRKIENGIRSMREGKLGSNEFFERMRGTGELAKQIKSVFKTFAKKFGIDSVPPALDCEHFQRPNGMPGQQTLF